MNNETSKDIDYILQFINKCTVYIYSRAVIRYYKQFLRDYLKA